MSQEECMNCNGSGCMNCVTTELSFARSRLSPEEIEFNKITLVYVDYPLICGEVGKVFIVSFHYCGK